MFHLPSQYTQSNLLDFFDETTSKELSESMLNLIHQKGAVELKQLTVYSDSSQKIYQMTMSPLKDSKDTISGVVLIVNDITNQKMMELELEQLRQKAAQSGTQEDAQAYNDLTNMCSRFEKKLHDLELTRMISIQMGPQTRLIQNNDTLMLEKIQSSLVNTIPLWKSQMVLALGLEHSRQATAAQSAVTNMTNELLQKNADMLKMGTVETAREAERSVVDIQTLQHTNQQLISTLDEVMKIQQEGAQKRREAEVELGRIEGELKQKLLELRG